MTTVAAFAKLVEGSVVGDDTLLIEDIADLEHAGPNHLSFFANVKYKKQVLQTRAAAVLAREPVAEATCTFILCSDPYLALAKIAQTLHPQPVVPVGIHPKAFVDEQAVVHPTATVAANATVMAGAQIGARSHVGAGCVVGHHVVLGEDVVLHPNSTVLDRCTLGNRVIVHSGTVIGSDGFGYAEDKQGVRHKIPQVGIVVIEDDVEIGANTTIDRATFGATRIGKGCKIDNLVQIGHNVELDEHCVIVSQSGISGSTRLGKFVVMGAQTGLVGHLKIASRTVFAARAAAIHSIDEPNVYSGVPAILHKEWLKSKALQYMLPEFRKRLRTIEEQIKTLDETKE